MRLQIRRRGIEVTGELRDHVGERLEQVLGRFVRHVALVRVYLGDLNGPRGGLDKMCRIVVEMPRDGRVVVSGTDADVHAAIAETASLRRVRRRTPLEAPADTASPCGRLVIPTAVDEIVKKPKLIVSEVDDKRLEVVIGLARRDSRVPKASLAALQGELDRARIVPSGKVPADVVTMNSVVRLRDLDSDETEEYELVYPADADIEHNRISVLAPIGTAILGYRLGDVIEWSVPDGVRRLRVEELLYQPERAGALSC